MEKEYCKREFAKKKKQVMDALAELADMTGGGLCIEDVDCDGGFYALRDIEVDDKNNVILKAYMWEETELSKKTGYWKDVEGTTSEFCQK